MSADSVSTDGWVRFAESCDACGRPRARGEQFGGAYGKDGRRGAVCSTCIAQIAADPVEYGQRSRLNEMPFVLEPELLEQAECWGCGGHDFWQDETGANVCVRCCPVPHLKLLGQTADGDQ